MRNFYFYRITLWDEKELTFYGIIEENSFVGAMEKLDKEFGGEDILNVELTEQEGIFTITNKEVFNAMVESYNGIV